MKAIRYGLCILATLCILTTAAMTTADRAEAAGPNPVVVMETTLGRIMVMLDPKAAPVTVKNFLQYVDARFYDKTIFHRVIKSTDGKGLNIVQGGGFEYPLAQKRPLWGPIPLEDKNGLTNDMGTIAMARTGMPNSATSQFYFNVKDNPALNGEGGFGNGAARRGYAVFGKVIRGMDVVLKIQAIQTGNRGMHQDVPLKPIYLIKAYRAK